MVDTEDNTTRSGVTRRTLLAGTIVTPLASSIGVRADSTVDAASITTLYQEWQSADAEAARWCRKWGELETVLVRSLGYPRVPISLPNSSDIMWATTHEDIDYHLKNSPDSDVLGPRLHEHLVSQKASWEMQADAIGMLEAERQETKAWDKREAIALRVFSLRADDLASIIIKLTLIQRMGETRKNDDEFPWPQIGAIISDLKRLTDERTTI
jgi:hypothetical protein